MDATLLSRIQFALTAGFHFIYPPLTIGLAWFIVWMMTKYKNTGDDFHRHTARFWVKVFTITFAVGVATGITMEFEFGTNWSEYCRYVGDIFGAPLAAEGIFSFFLESSFIAVLIFGWNRVSRKTLWFSSLMVAVGATLSAFWIIAANSWQQTPAGFVVRNGRAELTDFWAALFNPSTIPRYLHTIDGAIVTGAFFMVGVGAWMLLKGRHTEFAWESMKVPLVIAFIASILQLGLGHYHATQVARTQPEKLAAIEGIFETQRRAPALVFGIPDDDTETMRAAVQIPGLLSLLAFGDLNAEVKGLKDFPKADRPPVELTFYPFHLMVVLGAFFIAFTATGVYLLWKKKLFSNRPFLMLACWAVPLPFISNELGWISAEVGRQPWIVYHLLRTSEGVSKSVPAGQILFSILLLTCLYTILFLAWIFLIRQHIHRGPETGNNRSGKEV
jgi:cytochrome d ubiquinol oxidase subunit I